MHIFWTYKANYALSPWPARRVPHKIDHQQAREYAMDHIIGRMGKFSNPNKEEMDYINGVTYHVTYIGLDGNLEWVLIGGTEIWGSWDPQGAC